MLIFWSPRKIQPDLTKRMGWLDLTARPSQRLLANASDRVWLCLEGIFSPCLWEIDKSVVALLAAVCIIGTN